MRNKYVFCTTVIALVIASWLTIVQADCPGPSEITYFHTGLIHSESNWTAPFYEGYTEGPYFGDKHAVKFIKVEWGRADGILKTDGDDGSTLCFYRGDKGSLIMMGQNDWGHVPQPTNQNWRPGYDTTGGSHDAMKAVLICRTHCHFDYGE